MTIERLNFGAAAPYDAGTLAVHVARYGVVASLCRGRRVLDVACGQGYGAWLMASRWGAASVVAVDVDGDTIAAARRLFPHPAIAWVEMDGDALDPATLQPPFDLIVTVETLEHLADPQRFLASLGSLRSTDGTIVVSCPNDPWFYGTGRSKNVFHRHTFTFDRFRAVAEASLGPASRYLLGTTIGGFVTLPTDPSRVSGSVAGTSVENLQLAHEHTALLLPPDDTQATTRDAALYWVGVWGPVESPASTVAFATSADAPYRVDTVRPPRGFQGHDRTRLVLVADVRDWAYDNIAQQIGRHLGDVWDVRVVYLADYESATDCLFDVVTNREADVAHFFWREALFDILGGSSPAAIAARHGVDVEAFGARLAVVAFTTSVYDHLYTTPDALASREPFLWLVDAYSVSSEILHGVYARPGLPAPDLVIEDGVDLELFRPPPDGRPQDGGRALVVGWSGNSEWNRTADTDPKGFHTVLLPAIARLRADGVAVDVHLADVAVARRPRDEMPAFYQGIDVLVCSSVAEGTPNPVLEAMACGAAVVSTEVGIVPQVLGHEQRPFMLRERTPDVFAAALRRLAEDRALLRRLAEENVRRIRDWTWAQQMPKWMALFRLAMQRNDWRATQRKRWGWARDRARLDRQSEQLEAVRRHLREHADALRSAEQLARDRWDLMQRLEEAVRDRDRTIAATEAMAVERWDIMQRQAAYAAQLEAALTERDARLDQLHARVAGLEADLRYARSPRGMARTLAGRALGRP